MPEQGTAGTGSEPVIDPNLTQDPDSSTGDPSIQAQDPDSPTGEKPAPFDKDPRWKSARLAEKALQELLKANDLTDVEDLKDLVESGRKVHGKVQDVDNIETIIEKAHKLEQYEAYWAHQAELEKRQSEDPNDTIKRLEVELQKKNQSEQQAIQQQEADKNIRVYNSTVESAVSEVFNESTKEQKEFLTWAFGVDHPFGAIDITDKRAIARMVKEGKGKIEKFEQAVIKKYLEGKDATPNITSTRSGGTVPTTPQIKNLKEARQAAIKAFGG